METVRPEGIGRFVAVVAGGGVTYDPDAQALFTASGATDAAQKLAISDFYTAIKATSGLYAKFYAMYFLFQGSASLNKWNGVNPVDSDAAFRLVFNGGITHNSTGIVGNGTTGYADTKFVPSTSGFTIARGSFGCAINTTVAALAFNMGCDDGSMIAQECVITSSTGADPDSYYNFGHNGGSRAFTKAATAGFFAVNRGATATTTDLWREGTKTSSSLLACDGLSTRSMYLLGTNRGGTLTFPSTASHWFAFIGGQGSVMTDADITALSTAVANLKTALGI